MNTPRKVVYLLSPNERKGALGLLVLMFLGTGLETLGIGLIVPAIAILVQKDLVASYPQLQPVFALLGNPSQTQLVIGGMLTLVAIYLIKNLVMVYLIWWQNRFADDVHVRLSQRLFAIYLRQPYTFHLQRNSAELIRNASTEVGVYRNTLLQLMVLLTEGLTFLGIMGLLFTVETFGAIVVLTVLGIASWIFHRTTRRRILLWGESRMYHAGLSTQHLMEGLGGAKDVKVLGREADFLEQYRVHVTQSLRMNSYYNTLQAFPRLWLELLAVAGLAILVITMLLRGRDITALVPTLGLFAAAAFRLMPGINRMLSSVQGMRFNLTAIDTLYEELKLDAPEPIKREGHPRSAFQQNICLSKVSYTYPGGRAAALNGLTLTICKGESVGFIGPSGAGKSTLVDIVLGLLAPTSGEVLVDGQDIQNELRTWQDQIGYVPQSIYLTDDTLRRNVAFGLPNEQIDDVAVQNAIKAAQLEQFISSLPDGLETVVGERGVRLSGGQRQRIGIARALYHDPAVLVLDEATSALDGATEQDVMKAVTALQGTKTILIVAHRLSTIEHCNKVYRLENGKIAEENSNPMFYKPALITQA